MALPHDESLSRDPSGTLAWYDWRSAFFPKDRNHRAQVALWTLINTPFYGRVNVSRRSVQLMLPHSYSRSLCPKNIPRESSRKCNSPRRDFRRITDRSFSSLEIACGMVGRGIGHRRSDITFARSVYPVFPRFHGKHMDVTLGGERKSALWPRWNGNTKHGVLAMPLYNDTVRCTPSLTPPRTGQWQNPMVENCYNRTCNIQMYDLQEKYDKKYSNWIHSNNQSSSRFRFNLSILVERETFSILKKTYRNNVLQRKKDTRLI